MSITSSTLAPLLAGVGATKQRHRADAFGLDEVIAGHESACSLNPLEHPHAKRLQLERQAHGASVELAK
jgi:hypothetical protein